jgi:hypothetical protein
MTKNKAVFQGPVLHYTHYVSNVLASTLTFGLSSGKRHCSYKLVDQNIGAQILNLDFLIKRGGCFINESICNNTVVLRPDVQLVWGVTLTFEVQFSSFQAEVREVRPDVQAPLGVARLGWSGHRCRAKFASFLAIKIQKYTCSLPFVVRDAGHFQFISEGAWCMTPDSPTLCT